LNGAFAVALIQQNCVVVDAVVSAWVAELIITVRVEDMRP
jgi:hypothetical protein